MEINTAGIAGTAAATPKPYRNIYGRENVYALWLDISRDSGAVDRVLVLFQEEKIDGGSFGALPGDCMEPGALAVLVKPGSRIEATGTIQTYKDKETGRTQLKGNGSKADYRKAYEKVQNVPTLRPTHRQSIKGRRSIHLRKLRAAALCRHIPGQYRINGCGICRI